MTREIVIAAMCVLATIAFAWIVDHPDKVTGSIILLVAFGILVGAARLRGTGSYRKARPVLRRKNTPSQK